ncbi:hypothetical protein DB30_03225 [Enhygromyxa salina]|uniref:Uncharacterized protein n=1 Tax=Enhygromyxa salina TaxID=215803 RepID=A0A0C1ZJ27_9BACT|nr:hypothetical protein [Enhygromyxa salina]KIG17524.1 hypothetical protein DB30_03225 [Enhygromyxa salina]
MFDDVIAGIVADVPDAWLQGPDAFGDPANQGAAYVAHLTRRVTERGAFVQEAVRARG